MSNEDQIFKKRHELLHIIIHTISQGSEKCGPQARLTVVILWATSWYCILWICPCCNF